MGCASSGPVALPVVADKPPVGEPTFAAPSAPGVQPPATKVLEIPPPSSSGSKPKSNIEKDYTVTSTLLGKGITSIITLINKYMCIYLSFISDFIYIHQLQGDSVRCIWVYTLHLENK